MADLFWTKCRIIKKANDLYYVSHPTKNIIVYVGEYNEKYRLPDGNGTQYRSIQDMDRKDYINVNNIIYTFGKFRRRGKWSNGRLSGFGVQVYKRGIFYKGYFKNDKPHGNGTFFNAKKKIDQNGIWNNGSIYDGYGTIFYKNNERYKGYVSSGKRDGYGILFDKEGNEKCAGLWYDNELSLQISNDI